MRKGSSGVIDSSSWSRHFPLQIVQGTPLPRPKALTVVLARFSPMGGSSKIRSLAQVQPEGFLYTHLFSFHGFSQLNGKKKKRSEPQSQSKQNHSFFRPTLLVEVGSPRKRTTNSDRVVILGSPKILMRGVWGAVWSGSIERTVFRACGDRTKFPSPVPFAR